MREKDKCSLIQAIGRPAQAISCGRTLHRRYRRCKSKADAVQHDRQLARRLVEQWRRWAAAEMIRGSHPLIGQARSGITEKIEMVKRSQKAIHAGVEENSTPA
jgi:hypothetical protein